MPDSTGVTPSHEPSSPSTAYVDSLHRATQDALDTAHHPGSEFSGAAPQLHDLLEAHVDALHPELVELMLDLAEHPETAFAEHRSARAIVDLLARHDIDAALGVHGVDTAIRAELPPNHSDVSPAAEPATASPARDADRTTPAGRPAAPTLAICAEYDALPEIGHACGHNVIAAMGVGAFLALAALRSEQPDAVPGRVVFLGTPAEEGHTGKEFMARTGAFDGLDAAVMAHGYDYDLADQLWIGRRTLSVTFRGVSSHASAQPFMGRNALDAASLMYQGIGLLRQQVPSVDRIHAVMSGGDRPSVIPDHARVDLYVRSPEPDTLRDLSGRIDDVARGAALMTGCGVTLDWDEFPASLPLRSNRALTGRWVQAQRRRGRDPLPRGTVPEALAASTDFGNVSYRVPALHPLIQLSEPGVGLHTTGFAAAATSNRAKSAAGDGAFGLGATVLDVMHDRALAAAVAEEFAAAGGAIDVPHYFD